MSRCSGAFFLVLPILLLALFLIPYGLGVDAYAEPEIVDWQNFQLELFADLEQLEGYPRAFQVTITEGEDGFPAGLYVTSGPVKGSDSDRLFHIDTMGKVSVVKDGFSGVDSLIFANEQYGEGMLLTEPWGLRIVRLLPDGSLSTFAELGTSPVGPSIMEYDPQGSLYVTDFGSGNILRVKPEGSSEVFANVPLSRQGFLEGVNGILFDSSGLYGNGFIVTTFTGGKEPNNAGAIYLVSSDGKDVRKFIDRMNGLELMTFGPGKEFGSDLFIASQGTDVPGDGAVYRLAPDGKSSPFITGLDAIHVVFDTRGILGGGMFVSEFPNGPAGGPHPAGKIWRVLPVQSIGAGDVATKSVEFDGVVFTVDTLLSNGTVEAIDIDPDFASLVLWVRTSATESGMLDVTLSRELIDSRTDDGEDMEFIVLVNDEESRFSEVSADADARKLQIPVPAGTEEVEIVGSKVVPELEPVLLLTLSVSVGAIVVLARSRAGVNNLFAR
jgi:hypothetical protein